MTDIRATGAADAQRPDDEPLDCLVIGGGPAGLVAATYLARFLRRVLVVDAGTPRCARIPRSHNLAGFPAGLTGTELLARLRAQALENGASIVRAFVDGLSREGDLFVARASAGACAPAPVAQAVDAGTHAAASATESNAVQACADGESPRPAEWRARTVLLATGVVNGDPPLAGLEDAIAAGRVRYCPVCDAYEAAGQRIAVLGRGTSGVGEALFVRGYSDHVTLLGIDRPVEPDDAHRARLAAAGIELVAEPIASLVVDGPRVIAASPAGVVREFDTLYSALGTSANAALARLLGAELGDCDCVVTDAKQRTTVDGLYAAGDVTPALDQVAVAAGQAAIAATDIHNRLRRAGAR